MGFAIFAVPTNRWSWGSIPYEISGADFPNTSPRRQVILSAINAWNSSSVINLIPRSGEADYAEFVAASASCQSEVGRQGGRQSVGCDLSTGAFTAGNLIHEIGHCIGLLHEHQRPDRTPIISVNAANIVSGKANQFSVDASSWVIGPYDCGSIMHYPGNAFGVMVGTVAQTTITILNPALCPSIGQRTQPSPGDLAAVRAMYSWFPVGPTPPVSPPTLMKPGATVTALWPPAYNRHLDLFATSPDRFVRSTWWEQAPGWQNWFPVSPTIKTSLGATTALWTPAGNEHLDLFVVREDGTVVSTWWEEAPKWQNWTEINPTPKANFGATVTALWAPRHKGHLDLFMTDADGKVWTTWWEEAPKWQPWFPVGPTPPVSPPPLMERGATVTALWAPGHKGHLDLFAIDADGTVWSTWWEEGPQWQPWFPVSPTSPVSPPPRMQPGAVTALWAPGHKGHLDLFATDTNGTVWSTWWEEGPQWQPWFPVSPTAQVQAGATVTALWAPARNEHLDLFATDTNGTVWSTWWEEGPGWQNWFAIHGETRAAPGATVTALWAPVHFEHLDLFMTDTNGIVWSIWWE
jgi:hypothetical protein